MQNCFSTSRSRPPFTFYPWNSSFHWPVIVLAIEVAQGQKLLVSWDIVAGEGQSLDSAMRPKGHSDPATFFVHP
jgi:hypothetical protein